MPVKFSPKQEELINTTSDKIANIVWDCVVNFPTKNAPKGATIELFSQVVEKLNKLLKSKTEGVEKNV